MTEASAPVELSRRELVSGLASGAVVAFSGAGLAGCAANAALGRRQLLLVSDGQLAALAAGVWRGDPAPDSAPPRRAIATGGAAHRPGGGAAISRPRPSPDADGSSPPSRTTRLTPGSCPAARWASTPASST